MTSRSTIWAMASVMFAALGSSVGAHDCDCPTPETIEPLRAHQLESLLGREVRTRSQGDTGRIIDLLTDRDGKLQAAVVEMGGFLGIGTRKIAIEWRAFSFNAEDRKSFVTVDIDREWLRVAPEYTSSEPTIVPTAKDE